MRPHPDGSEPVADTVDADVKSPPCLPATDMSYPVTYYCPHCGAYAELEREGYLADKTVTPYPLAGWEYATPDEAFEDADGVVFHCGEDGTLQESEASATPREAGETDDGEEGCGERFYLSFVRFEDGEEVDPRPESEYVEIDP